MKMNRIVIFLLFCVGQLSWSQMQFYAESSKNNVHYNERFSVDFIMNFDGDNFEEPNFEASGFSVVFGPSQSISSSWINGKTSYTKTYSFVLKPNKKGLTIIKQAAIEYNGKVYKTAPIKINVIDGNDAPDPNTITPNKTNTSGLFLVADISNTSPYVNEPVTITYKLYFGYNLRITNDFGEISVPKYNNFWSQNFPITNFVGYEGSYKGNKMRYTILKKVVLYPQKAGLLQIDPLVLQIDYETVTGKTDFWGDPIGIRDSKRVSSGVQSLQIKPLPEAGKPADFAGAVGNFQFSMTPTRTSVKNGEPIDLELIVSGNGNLKLFNLPKPTADDELEIYDPEHKEQVVTNESGMTGKIIDKYTIIPQYKGNYAIKPVQFSYFDTQSKSYKTLSSKEIKIDVLDGPAPTGNNPKPNTANTATIKPKEPKTSAWWYSLIAVPILGVIAFVWLKKKKQKPVLEEAKTVVSERLSKIYLTEAKANLDNKDVFYVALEKALHNFLKAKLNIETSEMSKDTIRELLKAKKVDDTAISGFIKLMENSDMARYAPASSTAIHYDYDEAERLINTLEKQLS